jgi:predicted acylesterase/phospholipase RssA
LGLAAAGLLAPAHAFGQGATGLCASPQRPFRILSIDGGGIKGVIPARILVELDRKLRAANRPPVAEAFDLFAGTSTGCIIAAAFASAPIAPAKHGKDYSDPAKVLEIYLTRGNKIFEKEPVFDIRHPTDLSHAIYPTKPKADIFQEVFGDVTLGDLSRNFMGTYYSMGPAQPGAVMAHGGPVFGATTPFHDMLLREVVLASTSAPIFFEPSELGGQRAVDGGVFANNPAAVAFFDAGAVVCPESIQIVAVGCGHAPVAYPEHLATWGLLEWGDLARELPILTVTADSQSTAVDTSLKRFLGTRYVRFQPTSATALGGLDDAADPNLKKLVEFTESYLQDPKVKADLDGVVQSIPPRSAL